MQPTNKKKNKKKNKKNKNKPVVENKHDTASKDNNEPKESVKQNLNVNNEGKKPKKKRNKKNKPNATEPTDTANDTRQPKKDEKKSKINATPVKGVADSKVVPQTPSPNKKKNKNKNKNKNPVANPQQPVTLANKNEKKVTESIEAVAAKKLKNNIKKKNNKQIGQLKTNKGAFQNKPQSQGVGKKNKQNFKKGKAK